MCFGSGDIMWSGYSETDIKAYPESHANKPQSYNAIWANTEDDDN
jgi:hypothetical protein